MEVINTKVIDKIDEQVQGLKDYLDNSLGLLKKMQEDGETIVQAEVDEAIDQVEERINNYLQEIRDRVVKTFNELYHNTLAQYTALLELMQVPSSLEELFQWVGKVIEYFFPQTKVAKLVFALADVLVKVANISNNILQIASYQSPINIPNIVIRPLNIQIDPIDPSEITGSLNQQED